MSAQNTDALRSRLARIAAQWRRNRQARRLSWREAAERAADDLEGMDRQASSGF
ncbi:hypothetical protein [Streptomyces tubercidicus]|uniref:hypothetical protein n=1 Tax=Streptomyces tubercidicus TaxID=47759 RepID=UPI00368FC942